MQRSSKKFSDTHRQREPSSMGIVGFMPTSTTVKTGRYRVEQSEFYQRSEPPGAKAVSHVCTTTAEEGSRRASLTNESRATR